MTWAPRNRYRELTFNFRSEGRSFNKSTRCLIPASWFYEFTAPKDARQKRKDKWRFTLAGSDWFCIAGLVRCDAIDGARCFHDADDPTWAGGCPDSRSSSRRARPR